MATTIYESRARNAHVSAPSNGCASFESGEVASRAALARREGVSRAHVTQVLRLCRPRPQSGNAAVSASWQADTSPE